MTRPRPGDFFTVRTGGWIAHVIRMVTESKVNHAGIYLGDGQVIEAQPYGAVIDSADRYLRTGHWSAIPLTDAQRAAIVDQARKLEGARYGYVDIVVLALVHVFGWHAPKWLRAYLQRSDRLVCSQLVDLAYCRAQVNLFDDGRVPAEVTPGDLYDLTTEDR